MTLGIFIKRIGCAHVSNKTRISHAQSWQNQGIIRHKTSKSSLLDISGTANAGKYRHLRSRLDVWLSNFSKQKASVHAPKSSLWWAKTNVAYLLGQESVVRTNRRGSECSHHAPNEEVPGNFTTVTEENNVTSIKSDRTVISWQRHLLPRQLREGN